MNYEIQEISLYLRFIKFSETFKIAHQNFQRKKGQFYLKFTEKSYSDAAVLVPATIFELQSNLNQNCLILSLKIGGKMI